MKKDAAWAIRTMSEWLASPLEFGAAPVECELWYRKTIRAYGGAEPCFLVRYRMPDGHESVGFVGPTTWSFVDLPLAEIEQLPKRWQQRRLLNLYFGWWFAFAAAQQKVKPPLTPKQTVTALTAYLKRKRYSFDVRAPAFVEGVTIGGVYYAILRGVRVEREDRPSRASRAPEAPIYVAIKVTARSKAISFLSLFECDAPVYGKLPLYHHVGTQLGPFKIARLGRPAYRD